MAEFFLPPNSKIRKDGNVYKAPAGAKNIRVFKIYRFDPDANENPREAVMRELWEETGVKSAAYLGETDWLTYEFPPYSGAPSHRLAHFRGQRQKWFALRFTGSEREIDPLISRNDQPPEFDQWRWEQLDRVADLVVPFRRDVYRAVAQQFAKFAVPTD